MLDFVVNANKCALNTYTPTREHAYVRGDKQTKKQQADAHTQTPISLMINVLHRSLFYKINANNNKNQHKIANGTKNQYYHHGVIIKRNENQLINNLLEQQM